MAMVHVLMYNDGNGDLEWLFIKNKMRCTPWAFGVAIPLQYFQ